jgi:hypothetical protein
MPWKERSPYLVAARPLAIKLEAERTQATDHLAIGKTC